tara:strand:- start:302 stop:904 length:603 start_codon:yes stop_codon:yes gene_type:complete
MKQKIFFTIAILSLLSLAVFVSASLYAEKIPDPSRFTSIEPLWSAELKTQQGNEITISLIEFVWLNDDESKSKADMFYLNDGTNEYIAESSSFSYSQESEYVCSDQELYNDCIDSCGNDESCIDECAQDYQCNNVLTCIEKGPDNTCGLESSNVIFREGTDSSLKFDPVSGQLVSATLKEQELNIRIQKGYLSSGRLSAE